MSAEEKSALVKNFLAGGVGGVCVVVVGQPFDTVKVRLQTMPIPAPGQKPLYTGTFDCVKKAMTKEGAFALYKGMAAPLAGVAPIFALFFFGAAVGRKLQQKTPDEELRGIGRGVYNYDYDAWGEDQVSPADVPASGAYLVSYEYLKAAMNKAKKPEDQSKIKDFGRILLAGGIAGMINWGVALPQDVLKSRFQTAAHGEFSGVRQVFKHLIKTEGPLALFKGFVPVMLRAFPANAKCGMAQVDGHFVTKVGEAEVEMAKLWYRPENAVCMLCEKQRLSASLFNVRQRPNGTV